MKKIKVKNKIKMIKHILISTIFFIILERSINGISVLASTTTEQGGVVISKDTFPDKTFRKKMKKYDKNKDGYLSDSEIKKITKLEVKWQATSMDGIEYLTNLQIFYGLGREADEPYLKKLDLTNNKKIKEVVILGDDPYESVDVSNCRELLVLHVGGDYLKEVNLSGCKKLKDLEIYSEKISSIKLNEFKNLTKLFILCNNVKELDLSNQNKLKELYIHSKNLTDLTLGNRDKIKTLHLYVPSIEETEQLIMKFKNVTDLNIYDCQTRELDVSRLKKLKYLCIRLDSKNDKLNKINIGNIKTLIRCHIDGDKINNVTIGKCPKLITFETGYTSIKKIDLSGCSRLYYLYVQYNPKLKKLNVTKNKNLRALYCDECSLESLDVSKNRKLLRLTCNENKIRKLDVSKNLKLSELRCDENKIRKLNVSKNRKLSYLSCNFNKIRNLDLSKNRKLSYLSCTENKIKKLDISKTKIKNDIWYFFYDDGVEIIW